MDKACDYWGRLVALCRCKVWGDTGRYVGAVVLVAAVLHGVAFRAFAQAPGRISLVRDDEVEAFFRNYAMPLAQAANLEDSGIRYHLIQDSTPNAFVAGGLQMFINTGIIELMPSGDALLAVVAHEMAHIASGDVVITQLHQRQQGSEILLSSLVGLAGGLLLGTVAPVALGILWGVNAAQADGLSARRLNELQADQSAVRYLRGVGYSPWAMAQALQALARFLPNVSPQNELYSTHPVTSRRIQGVQDTLSGLEGVAHHARNHQISGNPDQQNNADVASGVPLLQAHQVAAMRRAFRRIQAKVVVYGQDKHNLERRYFPKTLPISRDSLAVDASDSDLSLYKHLLAAVRLGYGREGLKLVERLQTMWGESDPYLLELQGEIFLRQGQYEQATEAFLLALEQDSRLVLVRYRLGESYFRSQEARTDSKAIAEYQRAVAEDPSLIVGWDRLATLANRLDDPVLFHMVRAERHIQTGNTWQAVRDAKIVLDRLDTLDAQDKQEQASVPDSSLTNGDTSITEAERPGGQSGNNIENTSYKERNKRYRLRARDILDIAHQQGIRHG